MLPGCHSDQETAEQFASHFKVVYYSSGDIANDGKIADAHKLLLYHFLKYAIVIGPTRVT